MRPTSLRNLASGHLMNILLLGSGGREHALAWKIAASPLLTKLWCAPGNAGIAQEAECVRARRRGPSGGDRVLQATTPWISSWSARRRRWPRASSTTSRQSASRRSGRRKQAAQLEGSKGFTKDLCSEFNIPTGAYGRFTTADDALAYVRKQGAPIVVKADGLAAGKGVVVAKTLAEAEAAIAMMFDGAFGAAGTEVVIEEFLEGQRDQLLRAVRRRDCDPARLRAGPQARLRSRRGPEHRRHGRLFADAVRDA